MKCDICDSRDTYIKDYEHNYIIKGREISFISKRRFCSSCDNLVYDPNLDNNASVIAIEKYNKEYGITKEEIIDLRNMYKLSQELFSKVIGCAKKTLISYEKGKSIPNDSYLIILKSLLSKPETINVLIDANKDQFSEKELNKIKNNISKNTNYVPSEYNGYSKISKDKICNIIIYFANKGILKTKLLKEMFYADFLYYKNNCKSITGLEYAKLPYGPVPDKFEELINECIKDNMIDYNIEYSNQYEYHNIKSIKEFDESLFSDEELTILKQVNDKFKSFTSKDIVDYSHKEKAFINNQYGDKISYDYAFDIDLI